MIFPSIAGSNFSNLYIGLSDFATGQAADAPMPRIPEILHAYWPVYLNTPANEAIKGAIQAIYNTASDDIESIKKVCVDRRYTADGAASQSFEIFKGLKNRGVESLIRNQSWVERKAADLAGQFDTLPVKKDHNGTGQEWRQRIIGTANDSVNRLLAVAALVRDGNLDILPAVALVNPGLSGLTAADHKMISDYAKVNGNLAEFTELWIMAEAFNALRMAIIRSANAVLTVAPIDTYKKNAEMQALERMPNMAALTAKIRGIDESLAMFGQQIVPEDDEEEEEGDKKEPEPESIEKGKTKQDENTLNPGGMSA